MYMKITESESERVERLKKEEEKEKEESFSSEFAKDEAKESMIEVAIDELKGIANITIPLEELQIMMKLFKAIDNAVNQKQSKGISR